MKINKTYGAIARETGLSVSFVSRVLRGKRDPSVSSLLRLAKALNMTIAQLVKALRKEKRKNDKEEQREK